MARKKLGKIKDLTGEVTSAAAGAAAGAAGGVKDAVKGVAKLPLDVAGKAAGTVTSLVPGRKGAAGTAPAPTEAAAPASTSVPTGP
ncbi:MAG: hypothetical protein JHD04_15630, partial [Nocardioides sp.]|nr:hypothetical protein [Nocardioides sp.]